MLKRLGFIGAGRMAQHHARAALALGAEIVLAAVERRSSPNAKNLDPTDGYLYNNETVDGWRLLIKETDIDGVIVAAPWNVIPEMRLDLLKCDKPMLIEKPIVLIGEDFYGHSDVSFELNKMVGFNRRFYSVVQQLRERINQGGVISADVTISEISQAAIEKDGPDILKHLWELKCIHIIDLMSYLFGKLEIRFLCANDYSRSGFIQTEAVLVHYLHGLPIHLHVNIDDPSPVGFRVRFDDGDTWVLSPLERLTIYRGVKVEMQGTIRSYEPDVFNVFEEDRTFYPGVYKQMQAFLAGNPMAGATIEQSIQLNKLMGKLQGK